MKHTSKVRIACVLGAVISFAPILVFAATGVAVDVGVSAGANGSNSENRGLNANVPISASSSVNIEESGSAQGSMGASGAANAQSGGSSDQKSDTQTGSAQSETAVSVGGWVTIGRSGTNENASIMVTTPVSVSTETDVESYARSVINNDNDVASVSVGSNAVRLSYKVPAKLFGFINTSMNVTAQADASGNVTLSRPWYGFLLKSSLNENNLKTNAETRIATAGTGASAYANVSERKAAMIEALHSAFQSQAIMSAAVSAYQDHPANGNMEANAGSAY